LRSCFPPLKRSQKKRKSRRSAVVPEIEESKPLELTSEQQKCFDEISPHSDFSVHLIHGVTGSGKTEVYLQLLEKIIGQKKTGLILVPEISLTPQLVNRFSARFPGKVAVLHSHLTDRERTDQWWSMIQEEKQILIGARSALFCPLKKLGLIVVDEEHEPSFKQEEKLKYHARDAAIMRAKFLNIPIVLGSATPSLESWHNALEGKYYLHQMKNRVSERKMPLIEVINIKKLERKAKEELPFWMSPQLYLGLRETLERQKQSALFLNRRGMAQTVICNDCGFVYECPNCAISLTLHAKNHLVCHYCNYNERFKDKCPECHSEKIAPLGLGTEQIEQDVKKLFPQARVARADRDEIYNREQLEELIHCMENRDIDILVGTQMIAKGLDFPHLDLVGLVLADVGFHLPDFRASERSFQLLTQVSGRAGRHSQKPGQVIIQTYSPSQPSIQFTVSNDYAGFAKQELKHRQELSYPPFGRLVSFRISSTTLTKVERVAQKLAQKAMALRDHRKNYDQIKILGPSPSPLVKIRNKYRYHLIIKALSPNILRTFIRELTLDQSKSLAGTKIQIDVDPMNML